MGRGGVGVGGYSKGQRSKEVGVEGEEKWGVYFEAEGLSALVGN